MPSSANHCEICTFAALEGADDDTIALEGICAITHALVLAGVETESSMQAPHIEIANERIMAARGCAKRITEGRCPLFSSVIGRQTQDGKSRVFFLGKKDMSS